MRLGCLSTQRVNGVQVSGFLGTRHRSVSAPSAGGCACAAGNGAPDPSTPTILVAEDDPAVRAYVGEVLQTQGYHVLEAADGADALEVAAQHGGPIHLLLTDLAMPRLDGHELHRILNRQRPETRTVFMSGYHVAGSQPAAAFLPKPVVARVLVRKVREVLRIQMQRTPALRSTPHERRRSQSRSRVPAE